MKKIFIVLILIVLCVITFLIYKSNFNLSITEKVNKTFDKMTLEEKIGQMLMIYYSSDEYDETLDIAINSYKPGGFIIMGENISSYSKLNNLVDSLQKNSDIPMFISIDEEGGIVQRLIGLKDENILKIPSMQLVGKSKDPLLAEEFGKMIGQRLNVFGININFAPVADINDNKLNTAIGTRSFGDDPLLVSDMAGAFSKGLKSEGIIPVYKHFPGHGSTTEDPHEELPVLNKTKSELYDSELKPFIAAIEAQEPVIMVGHFNVPSISQKPCSLSKEIITDLLKNELGFDGIVITDALNMGAITNNYETKEIVIDAINAGVNILLMPGVSSEIIKIVKEAINSNEIDEELINTSVKKILELKYTYELDKKHKKYDKEILTSDTHKNIIKKAHSFE